MLSYGKKEIFYFFAIIKIILGRAFFHITSYKRRVDATQLIVTFALSLLLLHFAEQIEFEIGILLLQKKCEARESLNYY